MRGLCKIVVGDRQALPIRAITFATAGDLTPDDIACAVAQPSDWDGRRFMTVLRAHYRDSGGVPRTLARGESVKWARSVDQLAKAGADPIDQIKAMPAGLFVWEDNLRELICEVNDTLTQDPPPYGPGAPAIELNCCPLLTEPEEQLAIEGFDWAVPAAALKPEASGVNLVAARQELRGAPATVGVSAGTEDLEIPTRITVQRKATRAQQDKLICQVFAKRYWKKDRDLGQADILRMPEFKKFHERYRNRKTLPGWIRDVDPRPKETRRGRRKKR